MKEAPNFRKVDICDHCMHMFFENEGGYCSLFPDDKRINNRIEESSDMSETMLRVCDRFERE